MKKLIACTLLIALPLFGMACTALTAPQLTQVPGVTPPTPPATPVCTLIKLVETDSPPPAPSPVCESLGDYTSYTFDYATGVLAVSGVGEMTDTGGTLEAAAQLGEFGSFALVIEEGITGIHGWALGSLDLASIQLPSSLRRIESGAFWGVSVDTLVIPKNVSYIGAGALNGGIKAIWADSGNAHYVTVDGVLFTKDRASLITHPSLSNCFSYAVPQGVRTVEAYAFSDCKNLESIVFPDGLQEIGAWAFSGCENLRCVSLPSGLLRIGENAFAFCGLCELVIPEGVRELPFEMFGWAGSEPDLERIVLPATLQDIQNFALSCPKLKEIVFCGRPPCVFRDAFKGCPSDMVIFYPAQYEADWLTDGSGTWCGFVLQAYDGNGGN